MDTKLTSCLLKAHSNLLERFVFVFFSIFLLKKLDNINKLQDFLTT